MDILTLYNAIRDGIADDAATKLWCQINYDRDHKVFAGIDDRNPPQETDCPYAYLFMDSKSIGYRLEQKGHSIGVITEIYKEGTTAVSGKTNIILLTGILHNETFRKYVETAVIAAVTAQLNAYAVEQIDIAYEDSEPYPFFRSYMGFSINEDYYQGDNVFE